MLLHLGSFSTISSLVKTNVKTVRYTPVAVEWGSTVIYATLCNIFLAVAYSINPSINRLYFKRGARDSSESDDLVALYRIKLNI